MILDDNFDFVMFVNVFGIFVECIEKVSEVFGVLDCLLNVEGVYLL